MVYPSGDIYEGEWLDNKMHGRGAISTRRRATSTAARGRTIRNRVAADTNAPLTAAYCVARGLMVTLRKARGSGRMPENTKAASSSAAPSDPAASSSSTALSTAGSTCNRKWPRKRRSRPKAMPRDLPMLRGRANPLLVANRRSVACCLFFYYLYYLLCL